MTEKENQAIEKIEIAALKLEPLQDLLCELTDIFDMLPDLPAQFRRVLRRCDLFEDMISSIQKEILNEVDKLRHGDLAEDEPEEGGMEE